MSWTAPPTYVVGQVLTAANLNTYLRDNETFLYTPPMCRCYNSAAIATATGASPALTFDSNRFDTNGIHSVSVNTSRLTCQTAGKYLIFGSVEFAGSATGSRLLMPRLNGVSVLAQHKESGLNANAHEISIATVYQLGVTDYVELLTSQDSGGSLNVNATPAVSPEFGMMWMGN